MINNLFSPGSVVITDRVSNVNRLIRRINRYKSEVMVDCRVLSLTQLAQEFVCAYSALYEDGICYRFVSPAMGTMLMQVILKNNRTGYIPDASKCNKTAAEILRAFDQIRLNNPTDNFLKNEEPRLAEFKGIMEKYETKLSENNELDYPALIIKANQYLNKIIERGDSARNLTFFLPEFKSETKVSCLFFSDISAKEEEFIELLKKASGKEFNNVYGADNTGLFSEAGDMQGHPGYHFFESYGAANEVSYVADKIVEKKLSLGDVIIIYASDIYENLIRAEFEKRGISYAFPKGTHARTEDYVSLILDMIGFAREDYSYQALEKVIRNPIFNLKGAGSSYRTVLREGIGWGRDRYREFIARFKKDHLQNAPEQDSPGEELQNFVSFLENLTNVFESQESEKTCEQIFDGLIRVANDYSYKADGCRIALSDSLKTQKRIFSIASDVSDLEGKLQLITDFLSDLKYETGESPDSVVVIPYGRTEITDRKTLFAIGLSNDNIAPTRAESPVFSDEELHSYATGTVRDTASRNALARKGFEQTLAFFEGDDVYLGYSDYDTVALLDNSRSILFNDILVAQGKNENDIEKIGYKNLKGSLRIDSKDVYDAYLAGTNENEDNKEDKDSKDAMNPAHFSSTSLQTLLHCPLRFYYKKIRKIPDVQHTERRPDRWLMPNQRGNLFHFSIDEYVNKTLIDEERTAKDEALLREIFEKNIEKMKQEQPCPSDAIFEAEKEESYKVISQYIDNLHNYLNSSKEGRKVLGCEVEFKEVKYSGGEVYTDETGKNTIDATYEICFEGSADRVDGYVENGVLNLEIIDYKTGSISNKQSEIDEGVQIQHYVYALAVKDWADNHLEELGKRFGVPIVSSKIVSMKYVFPFTDENSDIDVSDLVTEDLTLPKGVDDVLSMTVGNIQNGRESRAVDFMTKNAVNAVSEAARRKEDHCQYCTYKDICRAVI